MHRKECQPICIYDQHEYYTYFSFSNERLSPCYPLALRKPWAAKQRRCQPISQLSGLFSFFFKIGFIRSIKRAAPARRNGYAAAVAAILCPPDSSSTLSASNRSADHLAGGCSCLSRRISRPWQPVFATETL